MTTIKYWLITGDTHGDFSRFNNYSNVDNQEDVGLIILGDAGWNYYLNKKDEKAKQNFHNNFKFSVYCVRGNHEARPQNIPGMILEYDENVQGEVYYEPNFPRIRYFKDWGRYIFQTEGFGALKIAVIGGAYSVDKFYRLQMGYQWFEDEELTKKEMQECIEELAIGDTKYDLVLTHTCPLSVEPSDLFLPMIDQSTVSKNMEHFLDNLRYCITWDIWLFGHYHADRIERPHIEQFYKDTESLEDILFRWNNYDITHELDWWLTVSPNFEKKLDNPWEEKIYD